MKKRIILAAAMLPLVLGIAFTATSSARHHQPQEDAPSVLSPEDDWYSFIDAVAWKESGWNESAVGGNAVGYLQITPVLVDDVNRILGYDAYGLGDRYDRERSIEMFNVIQRHYNPQLDKQLALKIWNGKAPLAYHRDIIEMYQFLISGRNE